MLKGVMNIVMLPSLSVISYHPVIHIHRNVDPGGKNMECFIFNTDND